MHDYAKLEQMLCRELDEMTRDGKISGSLETIHALTDTIKNLKKIEMLDDDGEYSERYYRDGRSYRDGRPYRDDDFDRRSGVKRDRMGRYSKDAVRDKIISRVGEMMTIATTEEERKALEKCLRDLQED